MKKEIKKLKEFRKWFDKYIKRNYGKKCSTFVWNCPACHAHFVREVFDDFVDDIIATEKWLRKQTPKTRGKK